MSERKSLSEPLRVQQTKTLAFDLYYKAGDSKGSVASPSSCLVHAVDPNRQIEGVADTGTAAGVIYDTSVLGDYTADQLKGLSVIIGDDGQEQFRAEITSNSATAKCISITTFEITPSTGDYFFVEGYPVLASVAATVSSNRVSYQVGSANVTAYPHRGYLVFTPTFSNGDTDELIVDYEVLPSVYEP